MTMTRAPQASQLVSEVLGPAPLLTVMFVEAGIVSGREGWWALLPALGIAVVPYLAVVWLARRGRVSDRFVGERKQRLPVLLAVLSVVVLVVVVLWLVAAPSPVQTAAVASAIGLVVVMAVNTVWKLSIHMTIAGFVGLYQLPVLPLGVAIPIGIVAVTTLGWARVSAGAHTRAQVLSGFGAGVFVFGVYLLL